MERELIPTRRSLLSRLKNWSDHKSWQEFFDTYWKLIYGVALRTGLTHSEAQDVVQETLLGVAKHVGKFHYDPAVCSFKSWLLRVTRSKIARQFARRPKAVPKLDPLLDDDLTPLLHRIADPMEPALERIWDEEWHRSLMDAAVARVKRRVGIEQYQMFDLYVLKNRPVGEVARAVGKTIGHVYVAKHRVSRLVAKELQFLEQNGMSNGL
jgi:RNA polymerase sigma-70 factor (ECF subfamily)